MEKQYYPDECISLEQLQWYTKKSISKEEHMKIYKHLTQCELCANAVNGFATSPFTKELINKLHHEIDSKTKPIHQWNTLVVAQIIIVIISFYAIFGFYIIAESISESKK